MTPRIQWRRIGAVNIAEVKGFLSDPWAKRTKEMILEKIDRQPARGLLLNLREVEKVDDEGADAILVAARRSQKGAILGHNLPVFYVSERMQRDDKIPVFERDREAVIYFGRELSLAGLNLRKDRRRFPRIQTALPVEFEIKDEMAPFFFEGVVTNLSVGGLYAFFLDSEMEELAARTLDPFDLKMLEIRLILPGHEGVGTAGKVIRTETPGEGVRGVGLEFYHLKEGERGKIERFLREEGEREGEEQK